MPNDTDTEDVESPDTSADMDVEGPPEAGFSTGNGGGMGMAQPAQPAQPTVGPMAQQPTAGGGGGLAGNIQSLLQGGLTGGPNVGPMVQQRHGGLLTGLAGVLLDGLASGMAPDAETAARMPMIRQQQAMQQQQLQMQQQKMQEEMKLAPVREKLLLAQAQMQFMQLDHAMMEMTTQNQSGLTDFYRDFVGKKIASNAAEEVATGSLDDAKAYQREHAHDPDGMQLFLWPKERDAQGNITKASVVKILPDAWSPAVKYEHDYTSPITGKKYSIKVDSPAGPAALQNVDVGKQLTTQYADVGADDQAAKNPQQGLMRAINQAQQAGKSGQAVFDDPNVKTAIQAIQATQKPGGGFESEAYAQYAQGEQAKGRQPLSMVQFQRQLWPQTQIAFEHAAIAEKGEARKETEAANWVPGTSGQMKNKTDLAENIAHNSNEVAAILMRRPDIVGRWGGTKSRVQEMMGNKDPDIAQVGTAIHNIAIASQGIHGMRSPEEVERFETRLFNNFLQGQKATIAALLANARSVQTFIDDSRPDTYRTHSKNGGALRAMRAGGGIIPSPEVVTEEPKE